MKKRWILAENAMPWGNHRRIGMVRWDTSTTMKLKFPEYVLAKKPQPKYRLILEVQDDR